jgi:flagellar motor switch protein FliG
MTNSFTFLETVDVNHLMRAVLDEHPQIIAIIVSYLKPVQAALLIESLPPERQLAVIGRIAQMRPINEVLIEVIAKELQETLIELKKYVVIDRLNVMTEIFMSMKHDTKQNILENLSQADPEMVVNIKSAIDIGCMVRQMERIGKITVNK